MGQKRVTVVDLSQEDDEQQKKVSQKSIKKSAKKIMRGGKGTGRLVDKGESIEDIVLPEEQPQELPVVEETEASEEKRERKPRERGRRYKLARSMVDRTIVYPPDKAVELVKKTGINRFNGTISAHLNLTEPGMMVDVNFPHPTGKTTRVEIATDALLEKIEAKKIDFDILLSNKEMMPKLTKLAKILGPMGLMPNPKNGTITEEPEKRKKELESGKTQVKSESKNPLMHVVIGKTDHKDQDLLENLLALIRAIQPKNIKKLTLAGTMSPGIKVDTSSIE